MTKRNGYIKKRILGPFMVLLMIGMFWCRTVKAVQPGDYLIIPGFSWDTTMEEAKEMFSGEITEVNQMNTLSFQNFRCPEIPGAIEGNVLFSESGILTAGYFFLNVDNGPDQNGNALEQTYQTIVSKIDNSYTGRSKMLFDSVEGMKQARSFDGSLSPMENSMIGYHMIFWDSFQSDPDLLKDARAWEIDDTCCISSLYDEASAEDNMLFFVFSDNSKVLEFGFGNDGFFSSDQELTLPEGLLWNDDPDTAKAKLQSYDLYAEGDIIQAAPRFPSEELMGGDWMTLFFLENKLSMVWFFGDCNDSTEYDLEVAELILRYGDPINEQVDQIGAQLIPGAEKTQMWVFKDVMLCSCYLPQENSFVVIAMQKDFMFSEIP